MPNALPRFLFVVLVLGLPSGPLRAQAAAVVDEGTLTVMRNGAPIGRESFRIVRAAAPGGEVLRATSESSIGDLRLSSRLGTDSTGLPVSYECQVKARGIVVQKLVGRGRPGRLSVNVQTSGGESAREFVLNHGALLLDEDVFNHFAFVPLAVEHPEVVVITPRTGDQGRYGLRDRGNESVEVANQSLPARHFALTSDDGAVRDVWVDAKGHLLKVSIPQKGLVALRDDLPR